MTVFEKERPKDSRHFYWMSLLGAVLVGQQRYAEAEALLVKGYEGMKRWAPGGERHLRLPEMGEWVVRFYEATSQLEKARTWSEELKKQQELKRK